MLEFLKVLGMKILACVLKCLLGRKPKPSAKPEVDDAL